jgi:hypothetical protein
MQKEKVKRKKGMAAQEHMRVMQPYLGSTSARSESVALPAGSGEGHIYANAKMEAG